MTLPSRDGEYIQTVSKQITNNWSANQRMVGRKMDQIYPPKLPKLSSSQEADKVVLKIEYL